MEEQLITFDTAKLAEEKGFPQLKQGLYFTKDKEHCLVGWGFKSDDFAVYSAPTQSLLQKWIREVRGVHIEIHRNASGYYWSMCKADAGTDLGWSDVSGPNPGGSWDEFEDALENALQIQLSYNLPKDLGTLKHWGNYVLFAIEKLYESTK